MPDWFFDPTAAGTASGSSAANAFINPNSWFALQNSAGGLAFGDRVWFRRTSQASMVPSSAYWGKSGWARTDKTGWFIGWPLSGDPFYDSRPGDARSAGWDADVNTYVNTDINLAVWAHSGDPHPSAPVFGWGIANICMMQVAGTSRIRANSSSSIPKRNVHLLNQGIPQIANFDRATITGCLNALLGEPISGGKLTISASSVVNTAIFPNDAAFIIEELIINTNSAQFLFGSNINTSTSARRSEINRMSGIKPWGGTINVTNNRWTTIPWIIYDFYGEGPLITAGGGFGTNTYTPNSAHARINSVPCLTVIDVPPQGGTNYINAAANHYGEFYSGNANARALVAVTSGIPIHVRWPILTNGSLNIDPVITGVPVQMIVRGPNGRVLNIDSLTAGSVSSWSGTSVSAGSAWSANFNWTPVATGSHYIDLIVSKKTGFSGVAFIGHPLVNSA